MVERGPADRLHVPSFRNGCYYNRLVDCCWLCYGRLLWAQTQIPREEEGQEIVGTTVEIPALHNIDEDTSVEHVEGEITDVLTTTDTTRIVTIELETEDEITLGMDATS